MITIGSGLFEGQVWQRNRRNVSEAQVIGRCAVNGTVWVRVLRGTRPLPGFAARRVGQSRRGRFAIRITGVPVGGPYTVVLSIGKTASAAEAALTVREIRVGDVWVLAGQSNMQGSGRRNAPLAPEPAVRAFYMDDRWALANDPLHNLWNAVDPVHGGKPDGRDDGGKGVGPGLSFGHAMFAYTGVPQGLIACAHGGTSMPQWDPMHKQLGGLSLYGAMLRRVRKNGGRVAGVVWYQGESDSMQDAVACYAGRMRNFVAHVRRDFRDPRLPFAMVQLARYAGQNQHAANWNAVQEIQRRLPLQIPHLTTVPAVDLTLDDMVHVSGVSQRVLGRRLAEAMHALRKPHAAARAPIAFKGLNMYVAKGDNHATVEVEYANVVGRLVSPVRPVGFDMMEEGRHFPSIFDIRLEGAKVVLKTFRPILDFVGKTLHYAAGLDPATTITDSAGRPLPVMGPITLSGLRLASAFPKRVMVSRVLPGAGNLKAVAYPRSREALALAALDTTYQFINVYPQFSEAKADAMVFIVARVVCDEAMSAAVLLGYDGPVKLWIDGKLLWHDPAGTNPAVPDGHSIPLRLTRGDHEVVVALGSNHAKAWGVYLRFERLGVSRRAVEIDPGQFALPRFLDA